MISVIVWLIVGLFFLLLELSSPGFFLFISFFGGSLVSACAASYNVSFFNQVILFFIATLVSFIIICLYLKKNHYIDSSHLPKTNFFALIGKHAEVIEEIKPEHTGFIKVDGQIWSAKGKESEYFAVGALVEIIDVVGCHCKVRLLKPKF